MISALAIFIDGRACSLNFKANKSCATLFMYSLHTHEFQTITKKSVSRKQTHSLIFGKDHTDCVCMRE